MEAAPVPRMLPDFRHRALTRASAQIYDVFSGGW